MVGFQVQDPSSQPDGTYQRVERLRRLGQLEGCVLDRQTGKLRLSHTYVSTLTCQWNNLNCGNLNLILILNLHHFPRHLNGDLYDYDPSSCKLNSAAFPPFLTDFEILATIQSLAIINCISIVPAYYNILFAAPPDTSPSIHRPAHPYEPPRYCSGFISVHSPLGASHCRDRVKL